jgi:hypothetical protein
MQKVSGVRAVVEGDLPADVMEQIAASVRRAVLHELAEVDLGPRLKAVTLQPEDGRTLPTIIPFPLGIWFKPEEPLPVSDGDGTLEP